MHAIPLKATAPGLVIPAFQAARTLPAVLQDLARRVPKEKIVVVDDGSTDGTAAAAESHGVVCLRHAGNRGKGAALMTGMLHGRAAGWEWALTADADGQHTGADLDRFLDFAPGPEAGIVVGRRARRGTAMPWHRRFSNACSTWLVSRAAGRPVFDAQCGLRAYRTDLLPAYAREGRFEWEAQALVLCGRGGHAIAAVSVQTVYTGGGSHMRLYRDTWRFMRMLRSTAWTR